MVGVPYSETKAEFDANVERFGKDVAEQLDINKAEENLIAQAEAGNFDGNKGEITEMDALVAYLQVLGTMVDFNKFDDGHFTQYR
jgi:cytochrome c oxidase cbb3-type subunit 2